MKLKIDRNRVAMATILLIIIVAGWTPISNINQDTGVYMLNYPPSIQVDVDMEKLAAIAGYGGSLTGSLTEIESYSDVSGLSIEGAVSWSVEPIGEGYRVPGLGFRALKVEIPAGGTAYLYYELPRQLVDVVAGSRVDASAKILPVEGDVEASISLLYSPGRGGCPLLTLYNSSGHAIGELVLTGRGFRIVDAQVSRILVSDTTGESRVRMLRFYSMEVPPGYEAAYTPWGVALVPSSMIRAIDSGPTSRLLSPGGLSYPLFPGDELSIVSRGVGGYLAVKLVDPWGRAAPLGSLSLGGYPLVKGYIAISINGHEYTIGPALPLDGLYLFPLDGSGGPIRVSISNTGAHPVGIDYIGLVEDGVDPISLDSLAEVYAEPKPGAGGVIVGGAGSLEIRLGDYSGLLLVEYDIEVLSSPREGIASSPEASLDPSLGGWVGIGTGVVYIDDGVSSLGLLITLSSVEGAIVMVDRITVGYMSTLVVGSVRYDDPDETWCPLGIGINCIDDYVASINYTYVLAYRIVEVHESSNIWASYIMVSDVGYGILAEGYAINPDDSPLEPDDPIIGTAIGFNATTPESPGTSSQVNYYPQSIYSSNNKNATGAPEPTIINVNSDYGYLSLIASGVSLLLGGVSIVVSGPPGTALAVASIATGYYSLIFGIADYMASPSQYNDHYDVYILRDYDNNDGVSNATLGLTVSIEFSTYYDAEKKLQAYYYMPPGPTYPSKNLVPMTVILHNTT